MFFFHRILEILSIFFFPEILLDCKNFSDKVIIFLNNKE